ncbi:MAG: hypothetical protein ACYS9X_02365 [Planctomycetota bacterium]
MRDRLDEYLAWQDKGCEPIDDRESILRMERGVDLVARECPRVASSLLVDICLLYDATDNRAFIKAGRALTGMGEEMLPAIAERCRYHQARGWLDAEPESLARDIRARYGRQR